MIRRHGLVVAITTINKNKSGAIKSITNGIRAHLNINKGVIIPLYARTTLYSSK